jgi:sorting nexin-25
LKAHAISWRLSAERVSNKSGKALKSLAWECIEDEAIARNYNNGILHPALTSADNVIESELAYIRKVVKASLPFLFNENDCKSKIFSIIIREILACCVIQPTLDMMADPDYWNQTFDGLSEQLMSQDQ